jgi:hypothetical protein
LHDWSPNDYPLRVTLGHGAKPPRNTIDGATRFRVAEHANADVVISVRHSNLEIQRRDPLIPSATGVPAITYPNKTDSSSVEGILTGIAHFNHHLFRGNHSSLGEFVTVELYRLKREVDRRFWPENPDKPTNLLVNNMVDVHFPPRAPYGMLTLAETMAPKDDCVRSGVCDRICLLRSRKMAAILHDIVLCFLAVLLLSPKTRKRPTCL